MFLYYVIMLFSPFVVLRYRILELFAARSYL